MQGITSPSLTGNIVSLGRNANNYDGELVLSIVNQKLRFWDFVSDAVGFGFADSSVSNGKGTINSGIIKYELCLSQVDCFFFFSQTHYLVHKIMVLCIK